MTHSQHIIENLNAFASNMLLLFKLISGVCNQVSVLTPCVPSGASGLECDKATLIKVHSLRL